MIVENFREKMIGAGFNPPSEINADGKFHRFSTNGKPSDDAGWYVLNQYPIAVGSFGCWRSGLTIPGLLLKREVCLRRTGQNISKLFSR